MVKVHFTMVMKVIIVIMMMRIIMKIMNSSRACNFIKKETHRCLPVNFVKFLRKPFLTEHLWWLLLMGLKENNICEYF